MLALQRLLSLVCLLLWAASPASFAQDAAAGQDVLGDWQIPVTTGAASGYVPDDTCAMCHEDKAASFRDMGMAKSFNRPSPDRIIEDFKQNHYYHPPSDRHYKMELRGDEYWFLRYRLAPDGTRIDAVSQKVDWILGSGHHSRVYLYQTGDGTLYQLPLAWYSQDGKWAMAPGYEFADHQGLNRVVRHRCMACHNAYPEVPVASDETGMVQTYPTDLPKGIGCQRCHGPGAEHVRLVLEGNGDLQDIHDAIVNPAKLPRDQLYSICYGCHMQPTVAITPELRLGRTAYSFRPGQTLSDYAVVLDITDGSRRREDRFDINHHPYRMEQSTCFVESQGQLGCLTCHDPHVKIAPKDRTAHYRAACLGCHETGDDTLPVMANGSHPVISEQDDCTICHMPNRRTQDVIEVWMTDHRIVRTPPPGDLLAPIAKRVPNVTGVSMLDPAHTLPGLEVTLYESMAVLKYTSGQADYATDALRAALDRLKTTDQAPWLELAKSLTRQGKHDDAVKAANTALRLSPDHPGARATLGVALLGAGKPVLGAAILKRLLDDHPDLADAQYNYALSQRALGNMDAALISARRALHLRHTMWAAWRMIGEIDAAQGRAETAVLAFQNALAIHPDAPRVRAGLIVVLDQLGLDDAAARHRILLSR